MKNCLSLFFAALYHQESKCSDGGASVLQSQLKRYNMVPATALRLHNTVTHEGRLGSVQQIAEGAIILQYEEGDLSELLTEEDLKGVALTAGVLSANGFIYNSSSDAFQFVLDEDVVITINPHIAGGRSVQLCVKGRWCGRPVRTLHDLQNIYLDLTGKELALD